MVVEHSDTRRALAGCARDPPNRAGWVGAKPSAAPRRGVAHKRTIGPRRALALRLSYQHLVDERLVVRARACVRTCGGGRSDGAFAVLMQRATSVVLYRNSGAVLGRWCERL